MFISELFKSTQECPKCHSADVKTYSDGEKECNHCHAHWGVKDGGKTKVGEANSFPGPEYNYPFNPEDPRNIYKKKAYDNKMANRAAAQAERDARKAFQDQLNKKTTAPKLDLDTVWRKVEEVVGRIYPDGDPIDWLIPWFRQQGVEDFKISEILHKAARKHGYKDLYDYWDSMGKLYSESVNESAEHPNTDEILYHLTNGMRALTNSNSWLDVEDKQIINRIYNYWRTYLKHGDYESFMQAYDEMLGRYPDAAGELINAMFESAGLSDQATIEDFLAKVTESRINEISDQLRDRYVSRASDQHGNAAFISRVSDDPEEKQRYNNIAKKRAAGLNRALNDKRTGRISESAASNLPTTVDSTSPITGTKKKTSKSASSNDTTSPLTHRAKRLVKEDWSSSDWYPVIQGMRDTINTQYDGRITPESVEAAAKEQADRYYQDMGYDTAEDAVDRIISVFLARMGKMRNEASQKVAESKIKENFPFKDALAVGFPDVQVGDTIRTRKTSMMGVVTKLGKNRAGYDEVYFKVADGKTWKTPLSNVTIVSKGK
ncbi:MAG: hypothetical protein N2235_03080 [Fischerella sp.]|nr:hypothetical protein [Fischerella sp.]